MATLTFAAIDVGSFEVEMGIYEISNRNRIRKLDHIRHVTALGSDTYNNGKISYEMVEELCDVLAGFAGIMKSYKVTEYRAYATSAMREARNNRIVLDQIRVRTGIQIRIISNSEQRFLGYKAIAVSDDEFDENIQQGTAIVDVGFGSMQISLFDKNLLVTTENLPLGVLRIRGTLQDVNTTVEQYRDPEMGRLYQDYLASGPIEYMAAIFRRMTDSDEQAQQLALEFYGPMYLLYSVYDGAEDKQAALKLLDAHITRFIAKLEKQRRGEGVQA